jgi:hypothetical protein
VVDEHTFTEDARTGSESDGACGKLRRVRRLRMSERRRHGRYPVQVVIKAIERARTVGVTHETIASEMDNFAHTTDRTKDDLA